MTTPSSDSPFTLVDHLPVMEAFYTLQGEGYHQGKAAYFIRLGGCEVGCHWCDVKESWDVNQYPPVKVDEMVSWASSHPSRIAVITGGEPLMHNLDELCNQLHHAGFKNHIETSGVYPLTGKWDWICFSPKKFKDPVEEVFRKCNELKVIIYNKSDFTWAEEHAVRVNTNSKLYLQPEWSKSREMLPMILEYIKENPQWELSLQIHKFLSIP